MRFLTQNHYISINYNRIKIAAICQVIDSNFNFKVVLNAFLQAYIIQPKNYGKY